MPLDGFGRSYQVSSDLARSIPKAMIPKSRRNASAVRHVTGHQQTVDDLEHAVPRPNVAASPPVSNCLALYDRMRHKGHVPRMSASALNERQEAKNSP